MMTLTFRNLVFDELLARSWRADAPVQRVGFWFITITMPGEDDTITHAVTGQGETADAARMKAVEVANVWRGRKAAERNQ